MEEVARVYAEALFEAAKESGTLDQVHEQLDEVADAIAGNHDLQVFLFSPYFSSSEKREGLDEAISGAEPELVNFLELLVEKHRMPAIFRIRERLDELWAEENKQLDVTVTSAIDLDKSVIDHIREQIEKQTDRTVELTAQVDPDILGGLVLRVGNMVLDASLRSKLEKLRKEVAAAA
jgi:F-type H+-transporting ATPase subunit delta